jgi:tetratricopeptide (TPR) repeat protein
MAGARASYEEARRLAEEAETQGGAAEQVREVLGTAYHRFANMLSQTGDPAWALKVYGKALAIRQKLADANPKIPDYRNDVASSQSNIADVLRRLGRNAQAREGYEQAIALRERLVQDHPEVTTYRSDLASSLRRRGLARLGLGDPGGAAADTRRALEMLDGLPSRSGQEWFETACCHAALGGFAGRDGSGVSADDGQAQTDKAIA